MEDSSYLELPSLPLSIKLPRAGRGSAEAKNQFYEQPIEFPQLKHL
jgi:hypothetical protein